MTPLFHLSFRARSKCTTQLQRRPLTPCPLLSRVDLQESALSLSPPLGPGVQHLSLLCYFTESLFWFFWDRDSHGLPSKTPCSLRRTLNAILLPKPAKCRDYYTHNSGWGSFQSFFSLLVPLAYAYWKQPWFCEGRVKTRRRCGIQGS